MSCLSQENLIPLKIQKNENGYVKMTLKLEYDDHDVPCVECPDCGYHALKPYCVNCGNIDCRCDNSEIVEDKLCKHIIDWLIEFVNTPKNAKK